jgi:acetoin utilization deacetylase AcuC-like enzyme
MAAIPLVWSDAHRLHAPTAETWLGVRTPAVELPARADAIRTELERGGHAVVAATRHDDAALAAVHDRALLDFLAGAWAEWEAAGLPDDPGQPEVLPYFFAHPGLLGTLEPAVPAAVWARTGHFAFDTMTPIGPGTWEAARGAADAALTAADLVLGGAPAAYGCCRPPGHHVTRSAYGGCCYLNNAAIAAAHLCDALGGPVALLDIDAHHGNGAQTIFYDHGDILTGSVHVDPGAGWFPHFLGFATEQGEGDGTGANRNLPLAPGTGDDGWVAAVRELVEWAEAAGPRALVVALGVDAAAGDPESPLAVTSSGFQAAGRALGALGLPTVIVQEGGYDLATLGGLVRAALDGIQEGLEPAQRDRPREAARDDKELRHG